MALKNFMKSIFSKFGKFERSNNIKDNSLDNFIRYSNKPILVISGQKTGSHLLTAFLSKLSLSKASRVSNSLVNGADMESLHHWEYLFSHTRPDLSIYSMIGNNYIKVILNIRDPRDVIVSNYYWQFRCIEKDPATLFNTGVRTFREQVHSNINEKQESFRLMIDCEKLTPEEQTLQDWFYSLYSLYIHPNVFTTRYEVLNGSMGKSPQIDMAEQLCNYLDIPMINVGQFLDEVVSSKTKTFRKGQVGSYIEEFSPDNKNRFLEKHSELLENFGYL